MCENLCDFMLTLFSFLLLSFSSPTKNHQCLNTTCVQLTVIITHTIDATTADLQLSSLRAGVGWSCNARRFCQSSVTSAVTFVTVRAPPINHTEGWPKTENKLQGIDNQRVEAWKRKRNGRVESVRALTPFMI